MVLWPLGEGEGGTNRESGPDMYTLRCVKWMASGKLLHITGSSAQCSVMASRGGMRVWEAGLRGRGYTYS